MNQNQHILHSPFPYKALLVEKSLWQVVRTDGAHPADYLAGEEPPTTRLCEYVPYMPTTCVTQGSPQLSYCWIVGLA